MKEIPCPFCGTTMPANNYSYHLTQCEAVDHETGEIVGTEDSEKPTASREVAE